MVEKYKLNFIVALTILLITIWLIRARVVGDFVGNLLSGGAIALIIWTLLKKEKKPAKLLEFFVKSLLICYVATSIVLFVWLGYAYLRLDEIIRTLVTVVLPLSLFPVAISVIIYGIFRIKLTAGEFFLSSWYVSMFIVFVGYYWWWYPLYVEPYVPEFYYSSFAGWMMFIMCLVFLAFLIAGILTIVYVILKKQKMKTQ